MDDLYYNAGVQLYLRIDGIYYRRDTGKGWRVIQERDVPEGANWAPLQPKQREAYRDGLLPENLYKG